MFSNRKRLQIDYNSYLNCNIFRARKVLSRCKLCRISIFLHQSAPYYMEEKFLGGKNGHLIIQMSVFPGNIYGGDVSQFQHGHPGLPTHRCPLRVRHTAYRCCKNSYTGRPESVRRASRRQCPRQWHSHSPRNRPWS